MGRMKDIAIDMVSYELDELGPLETLELFGLLVKSGMAWTLQGSYGRVASELIHSGYLTQDGDVSQFADEMLEELASA
ncbi:hypothetical protein AB0E27_31315 [Streptomyces sparsogenes]|uniref:DUF7417 domain-containing protein n=1 Tax=Streptomyces sparsogenes TaxID=67365 RepID=UPI0033F98B7D